jgi:hypothetical protein
VRDQRSTLSESPRGAPPAQPRNQVTEERRGRREAVPQAVEGGGAQRYNQRGRPQQPQQGQDTNRPWGAPTN